MALKMLDLNETAAFSDLMELKAEKIKDSIVSGKVTEGWLLRPYDESTKTTSTTIQVLIAVKVENYRDWFRPANVTASNQPADVIKISRVFSATSPAPPKK